MHADPNLAQRRTLPLQEYGWKDTESDDESRCDTGTLLQTNMSQHLWKPVAELATQL